MPTKKLLLFFFGILLLFSMGFTSPLATIDQALNTSPLVNAGPDQNITIADKAYLLGLISDDALQTSAAAVATTWSQVSGPGTVNFTSTTDLITTAEFSDTGTYILQLTADDGEFIVSDSVTITVNTSHPNTIRVPQDYATIQAGIDAAAPGDLVLVSPGTYTEILNIPTSITLASTYYTTGDDSLIDQTVIASPDILTETITVSSSAGPETKIIGFKIIDGKDGVKIRGFAAIVQNHITNQDTDAVDFSSDAAGVVENNLLDFNGDDGVDIDDANVLIQGNTMLSNGEGIEIRTTDKTGFQLTIIIRNNDIQGSTKTGIQLIDDDTINQTAMLLQISNNLVANNTQSGLSLMDSGTTSDDFGAASVLEHIYLFNNTFADNFYGAHGGDNLIALNNIFIGHPQIAVKGIDGNSILAHNLFWNNGTDNSGSNLDTTTTTFVDPLLDSNYHLQLGSPAINAGTAYFALPSGDVVLDLSPSDYQESAPDLGAFESKFGNSPPVATNDSAVTSQNTPINIDVISNDIDSDGNLDPGSVTILAHPSNGSAINNANGTITYTPSLDFIGGDSLEYQICDTNALCDQAQVTITITIPNGPPSANDDSFTLPEDTPTLLSVSTNDTDPDGNLDPSSVQILTIPQNGSLINQGDGTLSYTPALNYFGDDVFTYEICDTLNLCNSANVSITVSPTDDAPVANDDSVITAHNTAVNIVASANDEDPDGNLDSSTTAVISQPASGILTNYFNGSFNYTPNTGFSGEDSYIYQVCDTTNLCDTATVTISVLSAPPEILDRQVSSNNDDAEEDNSGSVSIGSSDLEFVYDGGSDQVVGMRFNTITVPQGALILNAYLQFQVDETNTVQTDLTIQGELTDNAETFFSSTRNISLRTLTSAEVFWSPPAWETRGEAGLDQQTPDLAPIIQEIVSQPGWASGNSLAIIITGSGERTAESYDGDQTGAPSLHIEYTDPPVTPTPTNTPQAPTNTPVPTSTDTPAPTATETPLPPISTSEPTATASATSVPATNTPEPTATATATPILPTNTPEPTATATVTPLPPTNTPEPSATASATPVPATNTPEPTATNTPTPPPPTATPEPTVTATATQVTATPTPTTSVIFTYANSEVPVDGTTDGDYLATLLDDGNAETITERISGGKPQFRYSYLEHKWLFNVPEGNNITFHLNAWGSASTDLDNFIFSYSKDDLTYTDMFQISNTSDGVDITFTLPPIGPGILYIRAVDTDRNYGNLDLDTLYVDHMYIRSENENGDPPASPSGLSASPVSAYQVNLNWTDNAGDEIGFYIERSDDNSNWSLLDTVGVDMNTFADTSVIPDSQYFYRVRAYNASGTSGYSNVATATTPGGLTLSAVGSKIKAEYIVDLSWIGSSATAFDVYRNGYLVAEDLSGSDYTDYPGARNTYLYQVCEANSNTACSNIVLVEF